MTDRVAKDIVELTLFRRKALRRLPGNVNNSVLRAYARLCISIFVVLLLIIVAVEFVMFKSSREGIDIYKVEVG